MGDERKPLLYLRDSQKGDYDMISNQCKPLRVGSWLIMLMILSVAYSTFDQESSRLSLLIMAISAMLTMIVLISLCEQNSQTAAWLVVIAAPIIISAFAVQIDAIITALFGTNA